MSVLYVVRHGQASFFSDDYDRLSDRGIEQARMLGRHWVNEGIQIDEVYSGTMLRQRQTADAVGESIGKAGSRWPRAEVLAGLDEYQADALMKELRAELVEKHEQVRRLSDEYETATLPRDRYRTFHRLLEAVMEFYISGDYESSGFEAWREFHARVSAAFTRILTREGRGRQVAVFTSGGPIGVSVQTTLQAPQQQAGKLNWRVFNASVTGFTFRQDRISLDYFNSVAHLPDAEMRTYR